MTALRLVPTRRAGGPSAPATPPAPPVQPGDRVRVTEPVPMPCGRRIRRGSYEVLRVEYSEARAAHRLLVEARLDCSALPALYHPPTADERAEGAEVPLAAQPARVWLDAGEWTAYASPDGRSADGPDTIPDHPAQND